MSVAYLTRSVAFSAAHRYYRSDWSDDENRRVFGPCSNPHGHGHNYVLEVTLRGTIDAVTGYSTDLGMLDDILRRVVLVPLDHQHLNHAVAEFREGGRIPTCENILVWLWPRIAAGLPAPARLVRLRLHEEPALCVDYYGGGPASFDES